MSFTTVNSSAVQEQVFETLWS